MKDEQVDLWGQSGHMDMEQYPVLEKTDSFSFACAGCGDCCRGREDIVLSGYDLWRIANYLRLPPVLVVRSFCRQYIGVDSGMPVVRLRPIQKEKASCPFLYKSRCAIHEAKPLVCALYPLGQTIDEDGTVHYFQQPTSCGGQVYQAKVTDYLGLYHVEEREPLDALWAQTCLALSRRIMALAETDPVQAKLLRQKAYRLLYLDYEWTEPFAPQFAKNKAELFARLAQAESAAKEKIR